MDSRMTIGLLKWVHELCAVSFRAAGGYREGELTASDERVGDPAGEPGRLGGGVWHGDVEDSERWVESMIVRE
jgi:hypothetical protein